MSPPRSIYAPFHWTLLVGEREGPQQPITWRRYDTLSQEHAESHPIQLRMGKLLDPKLELPPLRNVAKQPIGSNACGGYVLHYMESELRTLRGEWLSVWPEAGWKAWKQRLKTASDKLASEAEALTEAVQKEQDKLSKQQAEVKQTLGRPRPSSRPSRMSPLRLTSLLSSWWIRTQSPSPGRICLSLLLRLSWP